MADNPNIIGGNLNFSGLGAGAGLFNGLGGSPQQAMAALGPNYSNSYAGMLDFHKQQYGNVMGGYQKLMDNQNIAQQGILDTIKGVGQQNLQDNINRYDQLSADTMQGLINKGTGNATVQENLQIGLNRGLDQAQKGTYEGMAERLAGYQNQAINQNQNLGLAQLNWMNSITGQYPNAGMYGQLASQFGAGQQADADRAMMAGQNAYQQYLASDQANRTGARGMNQAGGGGYMGSRGTFGNTQPFISGVGGGMGPTPTGGGYFGAATPIAAPSVDWSGFDFGGGAASPDFGSWSDPFGDVSAGLYDQQQFDQQMYDATAYDSGGDWLDQGWDYGANDWSAGSYDDGYAYTDY